MTTECFQNYQLYFANQFQKLGNKLANYQSYGSPKAQCLMEDLVIATFLYSTVGKMCFYTEAELLADDTLETGDKGGCASSEDILIVLNKIKSIIENCD